MLSMEDAEKLLATEGQVRGAAFETDAEYIRNRCGSDGLKKIEAALRDLGHDLDYEQVSSMEWMAVGLRTLSLLVIKDVLEWSDDEIKAMGDAAPKHSFLVKLFMKFFISAQVAFSHAPDYWTKHYDIGRLEAVSLDEDKRHAVIHLYDFTPHPVYCKYLEGYFGRLFKFMFPKSTVKIEETSCVCNGDSCHEFLVDWET